MYHHTSASHGIPSKRLKSVLLFEASVSKLRKKREITFSDLGGLSDRDFIFRRVASSVFVLVMRVHFRSLVRINSRWLCNKLYLMKLILRKKKAKT